MTVIGETDVTATKGSHGPLSIYTLYERGAEEAEVGGDVPDPTQGATGSTEVRDKHRATACSENRDDRRKGPAMKTGEAQKAFVHRALPTTTTIPHLTTVAAPRE